MPLQRTEKFRRKRMAMKINFHRESCYVALEGDPSARSKELIGALLAALEKLHQRLERRRWTFRRIQVMPHMLGVAHPGQCDVDSRRRTYELKRALRVRLESLERLRQQCRQSLREPPLEQRRTGACRDACSIRDRQRVPLGAV